MDFRALIESIQSNLTTTVPKLATAIGILIAGWIIALIVRAAIIKGLRFVGIGERTKASLGGLSIENVLGKLAFWLIILVTLLGVFQTLDLQGISGPIDGMVRNIFAYLPQIIGGAVLALLAWLLAAAARAASVKALSLTSLDETLALQAGMPATSQSIGNVLFGLIILFFLPTILEALQLEGLLAPVNALLNQILTALPKIFVACLIGFAGWFVAKTLRSLVTNLAYATGADRLLASSGIPEPIQISKVLGMLVFIFVFVPALVAALDALEMESVSRPAADMLNMMLHAIPNVIAALVILGLAFYVGRFASQLASSLLVSLGFDGVPKKLGLSDEVTQGLSISNIVGRVMMLFIMLFAAVEAANRLGFYQVRDVVTMFIRFGGQILLGSIILAIGFWIANIAYRAILRLGGAEIKNVAAIARIAILTLVMAMGLRAMGLANEIVNMAFGLTLGAVAIAVALSFGLGGREAAGRQMEYWLSKMRH